MPYHQFYHSIFSSSLQQTASKSFGHTSSSGFLQQPRTLILVLPLNPVSDLKTLPSPLLIIWVYCHTTPTFLERSFVGFINSFPNTCLSKKKRFNRPGPRPLIRPISYSIRQLFHTPIIPLTEGRKCSNLSSK